MNETQQSVPHYADIVAAAARIKGVAVETPLVESPVLSERAGGRVFLKLEILQRTGSFKFRGAYNRLAQLTAEERIRGVVAFSSGNHAQGIASAAKLLAMPAVIVMPEDAPKVKIANTKGYGAEVVYYDRRRDKREEIAARIAAERGAVVVPAFDDFHIVAGQGTAGHEIAAQAKAQNARLDAVLVPCSGGGLSSGIALALSEAMPPTRVVAVEPEDYAGAGLSLAAGKRVSAEGARASIADSLMAPSPGVIPFALLSACKAGAAAVGDAALMQAVGYGVRELKLVVEPGGAAALAAILSGAFDARGKTIAVVLSGGNIDPDMLERCLKGE
jgi:threonine dehydratase